MWQGKEKSQTQRQHLWVVNRITSQPVNIPTKTQCSGSISVFVNISFPIGHLYLRKRKHSSSNTNTSTHIQISTAWAQHSESPWGGSAGSCACPAETQPCPLTSTAQRQPGGTAVLPRTAPVSRSTSSSPLWRIWTQHPLKPWHSSQTVLPFPPCLTIEDAA